MFHVERLTGRLSGRGQLVPRQRGADLIYWSLGGIDRVQRGCAALLEVCSRGRISGISLNGARHGYSTFLGHQVLGARLWAQGAAEKGRARASE
jgi:hypothetical protein